MIYIPLSNLRPGMTLARDVGYDLSFLPLLVSGHILTEVTIQKLVKYNIPGVYIQSQLSYDVEIVEFIEPEYKKKTLNELKQVFDEYSSRKSISDDMVSQVTKMAEGIVMQVLSNDECLFQVIEMKIHDSYTYTHSMYVGMLSAMIGIHLGFNRSLLNELTVCGLLHDIGKIEVPCEIINKASSLTSEEFEIMKHHPDIALERLRFCKTVNNAILSGIVSHHEKWDGSGYPRGLKGKDIPLYGRILALADVYDALTSQRSYRKALSSNEAIEYMMGCADKHFDYELLQVFLKTVAAYPVGTLVELSNSQIAVVTGNTSSNILRPKIKILSSGECMGREVDLASDNDYLNVTVKNTFSEDEEIPVEIYM